MRVTLEELTQLFKISELDYEHLKTGLINKIKIIDENNLEIIDEDLKHLLHELKKGGVYTFDEVCSNYAIKGESLLQMVKTKMVSSYRLTDNSANKILFIKSELDKEMNLELIRTTRKDRLKLTVLGSEMLTLLAEFKVIPEKNIKLFNEYYFTDKLIEDIAKKNNLTITQLEDTINKMQLTLLNKLRDILRGKAKLLKPPELNPDLTLKMEEKKKVLDTLDVLRKNIDIMFGEGTDLDKLLKVKLNDCDLSVRALNCLKAADIETIGKLISFNRFELLKFRNFGKESLREIEEFVISKGLQFKSDK